MHEKFVFSELKNLTSYHERSKILKIYETNFSVVPPAPSHDLMIISFKQVTLHYLLPSKISRTFSTAFSIFERGLKASSRVLLTSSIALSTEEGLSNASLAFPNISLKKSGPGSANGPASAGFPKVAKMNMAPKPIASNKVRVLAILR